MLSTFVGGSIDLVAQFVQNGFSWSQVDVAQVYTSAFSGALGFTAGKQVFWGLTEGIVTQTLANAFYSGGIGGGAYLIQNTISGQPMSRQDFWSAVHINAAAGGMGALVSTRIIQRARAKAESVSHDETIKRQSVKQGRPLPRRGKLHDIKEKELLPGNLHNVIKRHIVESNRGIQTLRALPIGIANALGVTISNSGGVVSGLFPAAPPQP